MYTLMNGHEMNKKYPETFEIPSQEKIHSLKEGEHVKLGFEGEDGFTERMWVLLTSINGDSFKGTLDNVPFLLDCISLNDEVSFNSENILAVLN
jgi:uncharacterized protein YegJ (DUF2314 family)